MSEVKLSCPYIDTETVLKDKVKGYNYRYWNVCTKLTKYIYL